MADTKDTPQRRSTQDRSLYQAAYGIDPVKNPKAARSTERAIAGEQVTTDEPTTNASPEVIGASEDTPPSNPLRYSNTELGEDPAVRKAAGLEDDPAARSTARSTSRASSDFDVTNPEDVTLGELEKRISKLSAEDIRKAQENDGRAGAKSIYAARLRDLGEE